MNLYLGNPVGMSGLSEDKSILGGMLCGRSWRGRGVQGCVLCLLFCWKVKENVLDADGGDVGRRRTGGWGMEELYML